jgi:2,5-dihydroxypyridine 5,6-dioxygenase
MTVEINSKLIGVVNKIIFQLGNLKENESLYLISDKSTKDLGLIFSKISSNIGINYTHDSIPTSTMHGIEPPEKIRKKMMDHDLIIGITKFSLSHTKARQNAEKFGKRFLSLADFTLEILLHPSLSADFYEYSKNAEIFSKKLSNSNKLQIKTKAGTNMEFDISERTGNFAPGYVDEKIKLGSPPDIEANIAPIENKSNGVVVVDGSIPYPQLGKLEEPVKLTIIDGYVESIQGREEIKNNLLTLFKKHGKKSQMLGEVGFGFNKKANLIGNMLIDEGSFGTVHFGFGSNIALGGKNEINFHLDFIFYSDQIYLNGQLISMNYGE